MPDKGEQYTKGECENIVQEHVTTDLRRKSFGIPLVNG